MYSAGLTQELYNQEAAFITAMDIHRRRTPREVSTLVIKESSHNFKKGFYRLNLMKDPSSQKSKSHDLLIVGGWVDVNVFTFEFPTESLVQVYTFSGIHNSKNNF